MQFLLSLIPDENETDPPTVEIQEVRGFTDPQIRELRGEIEDLVRKPLINIDAIAISKISLFILEKKLVFLQR